MADVKVIGMVFKANINGVERPVNFCKVPSLSLAFLTVPIAVNSGFAYHVLDRDFYANINNADAPINVGNNETVYLSGLTKAQRASIIAQVSTYDQLNAITDRTTGWLKTGFALSNVTSSTVCMNISAITASDGSQNIGKLRGDGVSEAELDAIIGVDTTVTTLTTTLTPTTTSPTTETLLDKVKRKFGEYTTSPIQQLTADFTASPTETVIYGGLTVEAGTYLVTSLISKKPKTMIIGKLWGGDTILAPKKGGKRK